MSEINLLSKKLGPTQEQLKLVKKVKMLSVASAVLVIMIIAGIGLFYIQSRSSLASAETQKQKLVEEVRNLQSVEQQYALVVDRSNKINEVGDVKDALDDYKKTHELLTGLPEDVGIVDSDIKPESKDVTFYALSLDGLSKLLLAIYQHDYEHIVLDSYSYSPGSGYQLEVEFKSI